MNKTNTRVKVLRGTFLVTLTLLILQYVFGMLVNLYVQFPDSLPNGNAWGWSFTHTLVVPIHVSLGTTLLAVALVALVLSIVVRRILLILAALVGLGMIVYAWLSGASFLANGQQNTASLQMAIGFIGAVVAYDVGYYVARPVKRDAQTSNVQENRTPVAVR